MSNDNLPAANAELIDAHVVESDVIEPEIVDGSSIQTASTSKPANNGGLKFVAVLALLFGFIGFANSASTLAMMILRIDLLSYSGLQTGPSTGTPQEFIDLQNELYAKVMGVSERFHFVNLGINLLHQSVAIAMMVAAIGVLRKRVFWVKVLVVVFVLAVAMELIGLCVTLLVQMEMSQIMQDYAAKLTEEQLKKAPRSMRVLMRWMQTWMASAPLAGVCSTIGWSAMKVFFFVYGLGRLRRRDLRPDFK